MTKKDKQLSLSIKTDENKKAMPLGIKSSIDGINHFTNWDNIVSSIDETGLRTDSNDINKRGFQTKSYKDKVIRNGFTDKNFQEGDAFGTSYAFEDSWEINKIKILDDLAFVAEDEYTDFQKMTISTGQTQAFQYFVERDFVGIKDSELEEDDDQDDDEPALITPGYSSWTASGAYTAHMPFMPGSGGAGPYAGGFTIKYTPSSNKWEVNGTIPSTGGWGGDFAGSATYDACSGGGATNLDITISGSHYCTATSATETYTGYVRLNISPGNNADESTCSAAITINSVTWGSTQYGSSGGCHISYSNSSIAYNGYTPPVFEDPEPDPPPSDRSCRVQRRLGSLVVDFNITSEHFRSVAGGTIPIQGVLSSGEGGEDNEGESETKYASPLSGDYEHMYVRMKANGIRAGADTKSDKDQKADFDIYYSFGGFLANDFSDVNVFRRGEGSGTDDLALSGIDFKSKNRFPDRKLRETRQKVVDSMGTYSPVPRNNDKDPLSNLSLNYSKLQAPAYPNWVTTDWMSANDGGTYGKYWAFAHYAFGNISKEELINWNKQKRTFAPAANLPLMGGVSDTGSDFFLGPNQLGTHPRQGQSTDGVTNIQAPVFQRCLINSRSALPNPDEGPATGSRAAGSYVHQGGFPDGVNRAVMPRSKADDRTVGHDVPNSASGKAVWGGYYYLLFSQDQDGQHTIPQITGIQFEQCLNSVNHMGSHSGEMKRFTNNGNDATDVDTMIVEFDDPAFPKESAQLRRSYIDVELELIKILPVRKCGKVDIYKRKSGTFSSVFTNGVIGSSNHGLQDGDVIEISGALYDTLPTGSNDVHPLNGKFAVGVVSEHIFSIKDAPSNSILSNLRGEMTWRSISNSQVGKGLEGWKYEGTIFSPTGKNGYSNNVGMGGLTQQSDRVNKLADSSYFFTTESHERTFDQTGDVTGQEAFNRGLYGSWLDFLIRDPQKFIDSFLETPVKQRILGENIGNSAIFTNPNCHLGIGAQQIYPYVPEAGRNKPQENYFGGRFGCDIDVTFSRSSGSTKYYTLVVGERGSDVSVDLFGLRKGLCVAEEDKIKFVDTKRLIPEYLPYGKTHVIEIGVDSNNSIGVAHDGDPLVIHVDTLFGGGNGIRKGRQPRGNDLLDQTERNPWTDFEFAMRNSYNGGIAHWGITELSLDEVLQYEEEYLGNYLNPRSRGSRSRYFKSGYWERHAVVHWDGVNIPNIYTFRNGQIDGEFLHPLQRDFGVNGLSRPLLEKGKPGNFDNDIRTEKITTSYFGIKALNGQGIDRFNEKNIKGRDGYWSIFPWVDSYGKAVSISANNNLKGLTSGYLGFGVLSASTSKANRTFKLDETKLPQISYPNVTSIKNKSPQIGQLNLVYLQTTFGTYDQVGYTQICAGGANGFPSKGFSRANDLSSGFTGTKAGDNIKEVLASCHLSYSDVILEKDRIVFSEQCLAENRSIIHFLNFDPAATDPVSKDHTISKSFNFPRNSGPERPGFRDTAWNVGDGFGSTFKLQGDTLLTNATDTFDEFGNTIQPPDPNGRYYRSAGSNAKSSVLFGVDQVFVYEKFKEVFEFSQKLTATTFKSNTGNPKSRSRLGYSKYRRAVDDIIIPLVAMGYDNKPGRFGWNISLAGRYDIVDSKIVLQDPENVTVFDRDFSETGSMSGRGFEISPEADSAKIEKFDLENTSTLTYEDVSNNLEHKCRINILNYLPAGRTAKYSSLPEQALIMNYNLEGDDDFYVSSIEVNFKLKDLIQDIKTTDRVALNGRDLIPRVILYSRDPQGIVTRNRSTDLSTGVSQFYGLDETRNTNKFGGYIAPETFPGNIGSEIEFDNTNSAFYRLKKEGFMGQHRGGAQDLFFYGTLSGSTPRTAQEVFAGNPQRTTLPYTYGGATNLADFKDGCSWIAPDVYHKFTEEELDSIEPYANIFKPTQQPDGSYSVTISPSTLKHYGDTSIGLDHFIDKERGGIWLGFVLTNVDSFDINRGTIRYEELATGKQTFFKQGYSPVDNNDSSSPDDNIGPFRYILPPNTDNAARGSLDMSRWFNARYPYCKVGVYPGIDKQGAKTVMKSGRGKAKPKSLSCFAEATVVNPKVVISGFVTEGRRYKASFTSSAVIRLKDDYTTVRQYSRDKDIHPKSVVAIGKSKTSANTPDATNGSFASSYQIISSFRGQSLNENNRFEKGNILSSFDVQRPEFLSLTIAGEQTKDGISSLFFPAPVGVVASGASLIFSPVIEKQQNLTPLFAGQRESKLAQPLFMKVDIAENDFTLNIHEIQPSSIIPLRLSVIDASGGINFNFAPPTTGSSPLFTQGPFTNSGLTTLTAVGSAFLDEGASLMASGAFKSSGLAPLHTVASITKNNPITLAMNLPQSGSIPLYIRKDFDASGQAPLTIFDKAPHSGNLNLFTGTQFDVLNKDLNLLIDVPLMGTGQVPLQMEGFALTADSNRNSNTAFLSKLPDGQFDKGDINGEFNEDSISKISSSKTVLSNSALGNAVNENFYDRNRSEAVDRMTPLQVETNYNHTFAAQKNVGNMTTPQANKRGTSDPAWNLAYGSRERSSRALDARVLRTEGQRSGIQGSREIIKKFYTNDTVAGYDRFNSFTTYLDFTERDFYDTNDKVLVKAGLMGKTNRSNSSNVIEISIYDIDDDGNLSQRGEGGLDGILRFSPCSIPLKDTGKPFERNEELEGVKFLNLRGTNNLDADIGGVTDSFWPIRQEIFNAIKSDFTDKIKSEDPNNQSPHTAEFRDGQVEILDLKVSSGGMCAISFRSLSKYRLFYKDGPESSFTQTFTKRENYNHVITSVLVFDIASFLKSRRLGLPTFQQNYNFGSSLSGATQVNDNYYHRVMPKEENKQTQAGTRSFSVNRRSSPYSASSIAFDYDDLYVNVQDGFSNLGVEGVIKLRRSYNYRISGTSWFGRDDFIGFDRFNTGTAAQRASRTTDSHYYNSSNNKRYIVDASEGYNKTFFGGKIKIFEEYESNKSVMLVGAMLFDPYVLQDLSKHSYRLNPYGAVYIYKKDKDQDKWDYHGAVYSKGYTSENIKSNLSDFDLSSTRFHDRRVSLFGYDFDYSEGVLFVSEPGGSTTTESAKATVNPANIYAFDISSTPTLIKTYNASDISINSSSLATGDNVGTHIAAFGRQDIFSFSDAALEYIDRKQYSRRIGNRGWDASLGSIRFKGESLIHNFRNNSSFGFGSSISDETLEYSRENALNELRPYFTSFLKRGGYPETSYIMNVWSRILSIKKISSKNKDRLLVVRKFSFRLNDHTLYKNNAFNVVKLQVVDLERDANGPLFIKAASAENNLAPLYNLAPGPSGKFDLAIKPIDYCSGLAPLFLDNRTSFNDMSLHTPRVSDDGNIFLPFAMNAFAPTASGDFKLFLKHQYITATPDLFMPVIGVENSGISLAAQGSFGEGVSASPSLVINRHIPGIPESGLLGLFLNQKDFNATSLFEAGGPSNPDMDLVIGTFVVGSGINQAPLMVKTFIPPIGPGGGFVGSGLAPLAMAGNNDAGIFFKRNNNISLVLPANAMANSGNVLFIEKAYGGISPLYIDSRISSGNVPTYVTGAGLEASGISLITKAPVTGNFNIFTRGWFD